jgi:hypothetical protein
MTEKQSVRQKYIDNIMKNKYADDDEQYYDSNLGFLQSLSLEELQKMCDEDLDEDLDECPVCGGSDTRKDLDNPETMMNCNICGSEWNIDGDVTLNGRIL